MNNYKVSPITYKSAARAIEPAEKDWKTRQKRIAAVLRELFEIARAGARACARFLTRSRGIRMHRACDWRCCQRCLCLCSQRAAASAKKFHSTVTFSPTHSGTARGSAAAEGVPALERGLAAQFLGSYRAGHLLSSRVC